MDVEQVVAQAVAPFVETVGDAVEASVAALAALRAAGFDVYRPDDSGHWWITTGVETEQGRKVVGPFSTKDDCFVARTYIEKVEGHSNYWIERLVPVGGEG